jgi:hypothetical protein
MSITNRPAAIRPRLASLPLGVHLLLGRGGVCGHLVPLAVGDALREVATLLLVGGLQLLADDPVLLQGLAHSGANHTRGSDITQDWRHLLLFTGVRGSRILRSSR